MHRTAYALFYITLFLIAIGIVMIYSTSAIFAQERYKDATYFLKKELLWLCFGMVALYIGYRVGYRFWAASSGWILSLTVLILVIVLIPSVGYEVAGARRWIRAGGFSIQPSELAKYAVIFYLSHWLARHQDQVKTFVKGFLIPVCVLGFVAGLVLIQPDLGTAVGISAIGLILLFVGGTRIRYLFTLIVMALPVLYIFIAGVPYRRARILAFLDPWKDPKGVGFQIIQSFIALGSGGLTGVGLGESRQKLFYLPEAHTDFIFSIIGEELGFAGVLIVFVAFIALFALGFRVVLKTTDLTGHLMGLGIVSLLAFQTLVNIGVVTGSLPTKGLPLPFISFGGSSLILSMAGIGILMNLAASLKSGSGADAHGVWRRRRRGRIRPIREKKIR